jgi:hypothetical protein
MALIKFGGGKGYRPVIVFSGHEAWMRHWFPTQKLPSRKFQTAVSGQ